jgi:uncharacterized protein (TIGR04255 family)
MSITASLKPINPKHSIKEAVISIFLAQPVIKPERFLGLLESDFKDKFQKGEILSHAQYKFSTNTKNRIPEFEPSSIDKNAGFRFTSFINGKQAYVLQGLNEVNRQFISFHTFQYERWQGFFEEFQNCIETLSNFQSGIFVAAYSIHYIDEFKWESNNEIPTREIFQVESEILPKAFFDSYDTNFTINRTLNSIVFPMFERLEIKVENNSNSPIVISHNITYTLSDFRELKDIVVSRDLYDKLQIMHEENKNTLSRLLAEDVQRLINLPKHEIQKN